MTDTSDAKRAVAPIPKVGVLNSLKGVKGIIILDECSTEFTEEFKDFIVSFVAKEIGATPERPIHPRPWLKSKKGRKSKSSFR